MSYIKIIYNYNIMSNPKNRTYKFTSPNIKTIYEDFSQFSLTKNNKVMHFFQLCMFKNQKTNKYHGRQFIIQNDEFKEINNIRMSDEQYKKMVNNLSDNICKYYNTYDLDLVDYPVLADISTVNSDLLNNNDYDLYNGMAPF